MEERSGKTFPEGQKKLREEIDDALHAFQDDYVIRKLSAGDLTASILSACVAIVKKGEAVDWQSAKRELPLATSLAVACKGSEIVGVGTIKREHKYAASVSAKSGVKFPPETLELGYVAVDPAHQGRQLSSRIATLLASQYKGRLFATTYNDRMKRTLTRIGFVKKGNEWKGKTEMLSVWERE
jgi:GNAT superfamily N-acetyltransferase